MIQDVTLPGALIAGILSFLSPCVLPLVPAYLSYISGVSVNELRQQDNTKVRQLALKQSLWFITGFSLVFILLGASATWLGQWLLANMAILGKIAGIIIVIFGIHYTGLVRIPWLMVDARLQTDQLNAKSGSGALLLGAAFAFGWTPCIGPILGAILAMAGAQSHVSQGIMLLIAYSAGLAIPFLLAALATDRFLHWSSRMKHHLQWVERISGGLLIIVGLMIFFGSFSNISALLIEYAPWLANIESLVE